MIIVYLRTKKRKKTKKKERKENKQRKRTKREKEFEKSVKKYGATTLSWLYFYGQSHISQVVYCVRYQLTIIII